LSISASLAEILSILLSSWWFLLKLQPSMLQLINSFLWAILLFFVSLRPVNLQWNALFWAFFWSIYLLQQKRWSNRLEFEWKQVRAWPISDISFNSSRILVISLLNCFRLSETLMIFLDKRTIWDFIFGNSIIWQNHEPRTDCQCFLCETELVIQLKYRFCVRIPVKAPNRSNMSRMWQNMSTISGKISSKLIITS
jgi:hypothetical protein